MATISHDNTTFLWTGSETVGNFVDDPAYVVLPTGSISVEEPTPLATTNLGGIVHGAQKNPIGTNGQGFCEHPGDYDGTQRITAWPVSLTAGDVLAKAISRTNEPGSLGEVSAWDAGTTRSGVNTEISCLFAVSTAPDAETFAPPVAVGGGGLPFKQTRFVDLDACVAAAPSYAVSSFLAHVPTFTEAFTNGINQFAFGHGHRPGATAGSGYQAALPYTLHENGNNYGREAMRYWGACALLYISDAITASQKKQILIRMISAGAQWYEGMKAMNFVPGGNGAHYQFGFIPVMFYLYYTQKSFENMLTFAPFHQLAQTLYLTQSHLDNELALFHANANYSAGSRARTITSVTGNTVTYDVSGVRVTGAVMVRQSDGARMMVTDSASASLTATVASQPTPALQVGDVICFDHDNPAGYAVGQGHWAIGGAQSVKNWSSHSPGTNASYRSLQFWSESLVLCEAMGWTGFSGYDGFKAYTEACVGYRTYGAVTDPWPTMHQGLNNKLFAENFWNTHYANIDTGGGTPPPVLPVMGPNLTLELSGS